MALYDRRFDPTDADRRHLSRRATPRLAGSLPLIIAAAIALLLIAMLYPRGGEQTIGDTNNAGPSVKAPTTQRAPSTSPAVPTPMPTTEPRPTQTPIP